MNEPRRRARAAWATRAQFLCLGAVAGVWGVHVPSAKAAYGLDERALAAALFATSVGGLASLFFAGRVVARLGARRASIAGGVACSLALGSTLLLPGGWALVGLMAILGAGESLFDIAINAEGAVLERLAGRPLLSGFHAMFSLGAMAGAAIAALLLRASVAPAAQVAGIGVALAALIVAAARGMLDVHPAADTPQSSFTWPRQSLLVIGGLTGVGLLAEGAMYNWSVLYVQQELRAPQATAALAYVSFAGSMALMRFGGDALRARFTDRALLTAGAGAAAVAIGTVLLAANYWAAITGFAVAGAGLATVVPILYAAAARTSGVSAAAAIASVSSMGMLGLMAGPPIVGAIAHATSLTAAMWTLVVAALILQLGVRTVALAPPPPPA